MKKTIKRIFPQASKVAENYYVFKRWVRRMRLSLLSRERAFTNIYQTNNWGDIESRSGSGSKLSETLVVRQKLPLLIRNLGIKTILDAPCGDFNWMKELDLQIESYTGLDIVGELIEENNRKFSRLGRQFRQLDICHDDVPEADLIICRDGLVHLSFSDIALALENFRSSGSRYLLTTVFPELNNNIDIATGMWRPLNLCTSPFHFPPPNKLIEEQPAAVKKSCGKKCLGLWLISELPGFKT